MTRRRRAIVLAWVVGSAACGPALDWRELRPEGAQVSAQMPCRPASHERRLALAGAPVLLRLYACRIGDTTYALTFGDVADPGRVPPALEALGAAARSNVQGEVEWVAAASVPGMTPQEAARSWRLRGRLPDQRAIVSHVTVFAYGTRVYQATVVGPSPDEASVRQFVDGLAVRP